MVDAAQARVRGELGVDVEEDRHVHLLACGPHSSKAGCAGYIHVLLRTRQATPTPAGTARTSKSQRLFLSLIPDPTQQQRPPRTWPQLLLLEAEALDLVEVQAGLLRRHVVRGHAGDRALAQVVRRVEHQRALARPHLCARGHSVACRPMSVPCCSPAPGALGAR